MNHTLKMVRGTIIALLFVFIATISAQDKIDNVAFLKLGSYSKFWDWKIAEEENLFWTYTLAPFTNFTSELDSYREKVYYLSRYFRSYWGWCQAYLHGIRDGFCVARNSGWSKQLFGNLQKERRNLWNLYTRWGNVDSSKKPKHVVLGQFRKTNHVPDQVERWSTRQQRREWTLSVN